MTTLYAEDINYWKTGTSSPDTWLDEAKKEIKQAGGKILSEAYGSENGRSAYMLTFSFGEDHFKAIWPVLPSRTRNERAARIQAATMLHHDIKNSCVKIKVLGARAAFFQYILLPDGRSATQAASADIMELLPKMLTTG